MHHCGIFIAVYKYLEYVFHSRCYEFIKKDIYPCLKDIISTYKKGTDFSIYMDTDGLIHAGSGLDQVTWMDVRVGDWVATPRHGQTCRDKCTLVQRTVHHGYASG